jgi:hypothetical protein
MLEAPVPNSVSITIETTATASLERLSAPRPHLEVPMSNVKKLSFNETIDAPASRVWEKMLGAETYPRWTGVFCEGSHFEGSWEQGSRIRFLEASGNGMVSKIAESRPHELISICHLGFVMNGVEDTESDAVKAWAPAYENYRFEELPEGTRVVIEQEVDVKYEQSMNDTWPKALAILKQICEEA